MLKLIILIIILIIIIVGCLVNIIYDYKEIKGGNESSIGDDFHVCEGAMNQQVLELPVDPNFTHSIEGGNLYVPRYKRIVDSKKILYSNIIHKKPARILESKRANWMQYTTWETLKKHRDASQAYLKDRNNILKNHDLDWSKVLEIMNPKLYDLYEYIGLINLNDDGKTLYISELYRSDIKIGSVNSETTFASISGEMVYKVGRIPALFMFHTHPAHPECCPLPSSHDLATSIYYATAGQYAGSVIISRFGVLIYGINNDMMNYFANKNVSTRELKLARLNYVHDVVAAHESIRSWAPHHMEDYIKFFSQYRMFLYIYPSSDFVASHELMGHELTDPIDLDVIEQHAEDIREHKSI